MSIGMADKIAIFQLNDRVAPRFDQCPELVMATIDDAGAVQEKKVLSIVTLKPQEVVNLLNRLQVKAVICGGVKEQGQKDLERYNIRLVDNVIGNVDHVLALYIQGKLKSGNTEAFEG
jgi:predicted Fe-Mo cluster-binding NifX family protein